MFCLNRFRLLANQPLLAKNKICGQASSVTAVFLETLFGAANLQLFRPILIAHFLLN
jgi:hypothetical protein